LAEQSVAGDDVPPQRQDAQQLQGSLVFVGLGIDFHLGQHCLGGRAVGGDEVLAGHVPVPAAACGLAVHGDRPARLLRQTADDPAGQRQLEGVHVQHPEELGEGGLSRGLAAPEAEGVRQGQPLVPAELGNGLVALGPCEHGHDRQRQDGGKGVTAPATRARIGNLGKHIKQGKGGRHERALLA
jgi:hypothetical protein